ncbi:MAG: hypothetical protein MZV64_58340 [Ignavibacteriales bacterium]|nr:hypothetical protein [Ignavibacteriales bacterium]
MQVVFSVLCLLLFLEGLWSKMQDLLFPESTAAAEIHKSGQGGGGGSKFLFGAMGLGAVIQFLGQINFFAASWEKFYSFFDKVKIPGTNINAQAVC